MDVGVLPFRAEFVTAVFFGDIEKFLEEVYGRKFNILSSNDVNNDSYFEFEVRDCEVTDEYWEDIEDFYKNDSSWIDWELVGIDLARRKLLPEGTYLIKVWW